MVPIFGGNKPVVDGATLEGGATQVLDGYVSLFILPAGDGAVALVDCGNDPKGDAILAALKKRQLGPEAVKAIFLTHGHPDHTAGCHNFPNAELYAFPADVKIAQGEEAALGPLPHAMGPTPAEKRAKVTKTLTDAETVTVGTLAVKAYAVPGHTGGSAAYLANGVLFMGDTVNGKADGKTLKNAPGLFSNDPDQNLASVKALHARLKGENADVKTIAPAHSGPIPGLDALLTTGT